MNQARVTKDWGSGVVWRAFRWSQSSWHSGRKFFSLLSVPGECAWQTVAAVRSDDALIPRPTLHAGKQRPPIFKYTLWKIEQHFANFTSYSGGFRGDLGCGVGQEGPRAHLHLKCIRISEHTMVLRTQQVLSSFGTLNGTDTVKRHFLKW